MFGEIVCLAVALTGRVAKHDRCLRFEIGETPQLNRRHPQETNRLMHNPDVVTHCFFILSGLSSPILADLDAQR